MELCRGTAGSLTLRDRRTRRRGRAVSSRSRPPRSACSSSSNRSCSSESSFAAAKICDSRGQRLRGRRRPTRSSAFGTLPAGPELEAVVERHRPSALAGGAPHDRRPRTLALHRGRAAGGGRVGATPQARSQSKSYPVSRSTRSVTRSVPMARTTHALTVDRLLVRATWRRRARGSSSRGCAEPERQRRPTLTRTCGCDSMLRTKAARCPCSATIQNTLPSRPSVTGVRRRLPDRRPIVSRMAVPGARLPRRKSADRRIHEVARKGSRDPSLVEASQHRGRLIRLPRQG